MSFGNACVSTLLRSPFHRLLSGPTDLIRYRGRRTGRQIMMPTQYERLLRKRGDGSAVVTKLICANLEMDLLSRKVRRGETVLDLQPREFRLLEYLLRHADQVVTRTMLLEGVWDYHFDPGTNVIDVHVSRLRRKLDDGFASPLLHTVRGAGYRLGPAA